MKNLTALFVASMFAAASALADEPAQMPAPAGPVMAHEHEGMGHEHKEMVHHRRHHRHSHHPQHHAMKKMSDQDHPAEAK